ncbi:hypothetical protein OH492_08500 [Vibrio chagasii]|nr:hypothetical protein [Vibrio chagasii]
MIHHYVESKNKSNARTIIIDPRYTDTAGGRGRSVIPLRPYACRFGSGLAHVMIGRPCRPTVPRQILCRVYDEKHSRFSAQTATTSLTS